jgi:predicted AlkP superfamily phosphohydrolase/phosphomutase
MNKTIVIGIDGATFDLIDPWIKMGKLYNFKKIKNNGVSGKLKSSIPHHSAPAWTSIITGCNPGKHGIYCFEDISKLDTHIINSRNRRKPAIWNYLTDINKKSIVINIPVTYPPEKINGIMITGLLTPSPESNYTYPKEIKEKLTKEELGEYELESIGIEDLPQSVTAKYAPEKLLQQIIKQIESRATVTKNLMKTNKWDFTMVVFRGTDTAQHFLIHRKDLLLKCYQKVDQIIGEIIETNPQATFFIVSDHGFGEIKKSFHPANVLYNNGFLKTYKDPHEIDAFSIIWLFINKILNRFLHRLPTKKFKHSSIIKKLFFSRHSRQKIIDFSKTKAFSTADGYGIQINLRDRYTVGLVEKKDYIKICETIIKLFKDIKDPDNDENIIKEVFLGKKIYGNDAWNPLDLILNLNKGYSLSEGLRAPDTGIRGLQNEKKKLPILYKNDYAGRTGDHTPLGIFFAYGKNIKTNYKIDKLSVVDILPLVFYSLNIPIPEGVDGNVYNDIFIKEPIIEKISWNIDLIDNKKLSKTEEKVIKKLSNKL